MYNWCNVRGVKVWHLFLSANICFYLNRNRLDRVYGGGRHVDYIYVWVCIEIQSNIVYEWEPNYWYTNNAHENSNDDNKPQYTNTNDKQIVNKTFISYVVYIHLYIFLLIQGRIEVKCFRRFIRSQSLQRKKYFKQ